MKSVSPAGLRRDCLGEAEVDDARHRLAVYFDDQNIRRLQVAMNDGLLMSMLHAFADFGEKFDSFPNVQFLLDRR